MVEIPVAAAAAAATAAVVTGGQATAIKIRQTSVRYINGIWGLWTAVADK